MLSGITVDTFVSTWLRMGVFRVAASRLRGPVKVILMADEGPDGRHRTMRTENVVTQQKNSGRLLMRVFGIALTAAMAPVWAVTLEEAVGQAVNSNPAVLNAGANARASVFDLRGARAGYYPTLDFDAGYGPEYVNSKQLNLAGNDHDTMDRRDAGLTARQLLWDGFATRSEVERRVALLNASEHSLSDTQEAIAFRAAESFLDVMRASELVTLASDNVATHEKVLGNVEAKSSSGVGSRADVEQALARLALARSILTAREGALRESESRYERVIGNMPIGLVKPGRQPSGLTSPEGVDQSQLSSAISSSTDQAMGDHPAVLQSEAEADAADAEIRLARAAYQPTVNLEGRYRRDDNIAGVKGTRNSEAIMVVARWNLFNGGADKAAELAAVERKTAASDLVDDTKRAVTENVEIAYKARAFTESRIKYLEQHVNASTATLQSYRAQFELSRRTLLDLLNAENELFNARSNLASGLFEDLVNQYFVEASKGRLTQSLGVSTAGP